jgi:hypothetical protein
MGRRTILSESRGVQMEVGSGSISGKLNQQKVL